MGGGTEPLLEKAVGGMLPEIAPPIWETVRRRRGRREKVALVACGAAVACMGGPSERSGEGQNGRAGGGAGEARGPPVLRPAIDPGRPRRERWPRLQVTEAVAVLLEGGCVLRRDPSRS